MQYVYALNPCVHRLNCYSRTLLESSPSGLDIVVRAIQWRFIAPDAALININNMKFHHCLGFVNFLHIRFCELQKASGITPWEKMPFRYCAGPARTGCAQQTFTVQNKPAAVARKPSPSFLRFWNWAERKLSMQPKFVAAQKMFNKNRNPANIRKWIARFYYFEHLYSLEAY